MANILQSLTEVLQSSLAGEPPPPAILQPIGGRLNELTAISLDPTGAGVDRWLRTLHAITADRRLHDTLVVRALQMRFPRVAEALTALGLIGVEWAADNTPIAFSLNWAGLDAFLKEPGGQTLNLLLSRVQKIKDVKALQALLLLYLSGPRALLALEYQRQGFTGLPVSGDPGISLQELIDLVNSPLFMPLPLPDLPLELAEFTVAAQQGPAAGSYIALDGPGVGPADNDDPANGLNGLALDLFLRQGAALPPVDLGGGWMLKRTADTGSDRHYRLKIAAGVLDPAVASDGELALSLAKQPAAADALLLGEPQGTHFAVTSIELGVRFRPGDASKPLFDLFVRLDGVRFALKPDFLKFLSFGLDLPALLRFDSDVGLNYVQGKGLSAQGGEGGPPALGVNFAAPVNLTIGSTAAGLRVDQVLTRLEVALGGEGDLRFRAQFRYSANGRFGPLGVTLDGAGVWIGRWTDGVGGLLPPQGIGLSLSAGPVSGGGFLKVISDSEFGGALQLKILGIGAFAYGLYKTLPNGAPSFVALIGIRLPLPGIQVGFGFAISGFGGLIGINRRADTDLLRERLAGGSAGDVLFNDDPMRNAPRLLGEMQRFFPDEAGIFLIGPTMQINWLYILKLDVGLFIELPGPRQIFIAGSARLVIGSEEFALIYLRMDFIGGIDLTKSLIYFDAALVNSHVLGIFRITGGIALRIGFGSSGYFLFSVGGFHPDFHPGGLELPRVARVGVSASVGPVWLKMEMYLALTSNTFQLGTSTEAGIDLGPIAAHGWFRFDALIQFKPFAFVARIDAGFDVEVAGVSLCGVRLEGLLSGPGPLVLGAKATVKLLFIRVSASVTLTLSDNPPDAVTPISNLPALLQPELDKPDNLRFEGEDRSVVFAPAAGGIKLFAPVGAFIWEQKRVPLNLDIQKAEGVELGGWHRLTVEVRSDDPEVVKAWGGVRENDQFSVGTYLILSDGDALNLSRFEEQQSGLRIDAGAVPSEGLAESKVPTPKLIKIPGRRPLIAMLGLYGIKDMFTMLGERDGSARPEAGGARVTVKPESWNSHAAGATLNSEPLNSVQAFTQARRFGGVALPAVEPAVDLTGVF
jgi:hypothetical protein